MSKDIKKIDVPNKLFEYRDELKEEYNIVGDFKRFDIVYVEHENKDPYIGILVDKYGDDGYNVSYINDSGSHLTNCFTGRSNAKVTLVEKQNPTEVKDDYDF